MTKFIHLLEIEFEKNRNSKTAAQQKAYMRHQFEFYGLKTTERREIQKPFFNKQHLPDKQYLETIITTLWAKPQREYQLLGQEFVAQYIKQLEQKDIDLFEYMIMHQSWWDTVDFIATKLLAPYFIRYPEQRDIVITKWLSSENIWLQRSTLLFQLKYKNNLDTVLLSRIIKSLLGSQDFFIHKAIGWVLREYSRTNPQWVIDFVNNTSLNSLSKKEALRLIKK